MSVTGERLSKRRPENVLDVVGIELLVNAPLEVERIAPRQRLAALVHNVGGVDIRCPRWIIIYVSPDPNTM